ncbi:helix-turn-helix domain-containing protein [Alkalihalobacillus sp. CinArs1]|uniref:helix-turn-helix domain-containing protein n=1 Tax=Alkalihalobacillus sp. CinArs1 TaxID=2995314 RepID=UPI0022DE5D2E|nr:helix-turn-helix domain-containing protein [Alkalihalobacillus sp. CinArs1]
MTFAALGIEIKNLRKYRGFSQKELSRGICSQAQISKIEKGDVYPLAPTLYELSNRLGVDINYFFERTLIERIDYVHEVYLQVRNAIKEFDYKKVEEIVRTELRNPLYHQNLEFKQFIMWHNGICQYHLYQEAHSAISMIDQAFKLTYTNKYYSEREIEILNSKGIIYLLTEQLSLAISLYKELIEQHNRLKRVLDHTVKIRLFYNLAKALSNNNEHDESITICKRGIDYCIHTNSMYLFGQLHFQIGFNHHLNGEERESIKHFEKAHTIFDLQNQEELKAHVEKEFLQGTV